MKKEIKRISQALAIVLVMFSGLFMSYDAQANPSSIAKGMRGFVKSRPVIRPPKPPVIDYRLPIIEFRQITTPELLTPNISHGRLIRTVIPIPLNSEDSLRTDPTANPTVTVYSMVKPTDTLMVKPTDTLMVKPTEISCGDSRSSISSYGDISLHDEPEEASPWMKGCLLILIVAVVIQVVRGRQSDGRFDFDFGETMGLIFSVAAIMVLTMLIY